MIPTTKEIERRLELCRKATPGPWAWGQYGEKENCFHIGIAVDKDNNPVSGQTETEPYDEEKDMFVESVFWGQSIGNNEGAVVNYNDADFITDSRNNREDELRELLALRKVLQRCLDLDTFYDDYDLSVTGEITSICHTYGIDPDELEE
jgi:hypothetical protein